MKKHSIKTLAAVLAAFALLTGCSRVAADQELTVRTETAALKAIETNIDIAGVLSPVGTENISVKLSGIVKEANADAGDEIKAGDTLVLIDTKELEAQLAQAQAAYNVALDQASVAKSNLDAAQAGTVTAENSLKATQSLIKDQEIKAKQDLDSARKALDATIAQNEVQLGQSKNNVNTAQKNFDRTEQLFNANLVSRVELDNAQTALETAQSQYNLLVSSTDSALIAAQAKLESAQSAYTQVSGSAADNQIVAAQSNLTGAKS
ncbi:MAG: HlyD family secretion protein, partial [Clostridiales bacterium]|nr:HlyD family secretion protein [Clostridiales bacterium]